MENNNLPLSFMGQEFILWLFVKSSEDSFFETQQFGVENVELFLEEQITLDSVTGDGYTETIRYKELTEQDDIKKSIKAGRIPSDVKVRIIRGALEWSFQLKAYPLAIKAIKLPLLAENERDEVIHERLISLEQVEQIVNAIFSLFLKERVKEDFPYDIKKFLDL